MDHHDHVNLLHPANPQPGGTWADFGAGSGAFTLALRELVGAEAAIYAVDKDRSRLAELERAYRQRFGAETSREARLTLVQADFSRSLDLPALDGIVMANSLHYYKDKEALLRHVGSFLKPKGVLLLVEYNVDRGNPWVPHPLSFETYHALALRCGFEAPRLLTRAPSSFLHEFYSAAAYKPAEHQQSTTPARNR
jgi:ubiquinone/menaquinone biosynthesis C-methylase UbiE